MTRYFITALAAHLVNMAVCITLSITGGETTSVEALIMGAVGLACLGAIYLAARRVWKEASR